MADFEKGKGDLLRQDVDALVNTVNTVGVMGKGIALQFRKAFPDNYEAYRLACERKKVQPGKMFVFVTGKLTGPRFIINFPTKRHWKGKTRAADIDAGLIDLIRVIEAEEVHSIAVPPLGCGNGGLDWANVKPLIVDALTPISDLRVVLFEPGMPPDPQRQLVATRRPNMTRGRAVLLAGLASYRSDPTATPTRLVVQKIAYLLQAAGEPLKLDFVKGEYGPYAEAVNHVLQAMDGHFILGVGDRTGPAAMRLDPAALAEADAFLDGHPEARECIARVDRLIEGFESPFGLELLSTVHWACVQAGARCPQEALHEVEKWNSRKRDVFLEQHVTAAWDRLDGEGWLASQLTAA